MSLKTIATATGIGAAAVYFLRSREEAVLHPDDAILARKVESEISHADVPTDEIDIDAAGGVTYLRGEVETLEQAIDLTEATANVEGVKGIKNLLHTPQEPAKQNAA